MLLINEREETVPLMRGALSDSFPTVPRVAFPDLAHSKCLANLGCTNKFRTHFKIGEF